MRIDRMPSRWNIQAILHTIFFQKWTSWMTAATDYKIADADDPILKCPWKIYPYFGVSSHIHVVPNNINFVYLLLSPILQFGIRFIKTLYLFRRGWKLMSWIHLQSNILEYIILNYRSLTPSHEKSFTWYITKKYQWSICLFV